MRIVLCIIASVIFFSAQAQNHMPIGNMNYTQWLPLPGNNPFNDSSHVNQKWYFSKYAGFSAGYTFFNGGGGTVISAPIGLQLNHPLNNNLVAFAGISAAPSFYNFSNPFASPFTNQSYPGRYQANSYGFGMNSRVEMGLMYINDARTFSISGSIGIERSSYPYFPPQRTNPRKQ